MSATPEQQQRELVRRAFLAFIAERQPLTHDAATIARRINAQRDFDFTVSIEQAEDAGQFLAGTIPPLATAKPTRFGATLYYQATSDGVVAHERKAI